jgi:hypothetical protein
MGYCRAGEVDRGAAVRSVEGCARAQGGRRRRRRRGEGFLIVCVDC